MFFYFIPTLHHPAHPQEIVTAPFSASLWLPAHHHPPSEGNEENQPSPGGFIVS